MKNLLSIILLCLLAIGVGSSLSGQQLSQASSFTQSKAFWNPAYTGIDNAMSINLKVSQQWLGFGNGAPRGINLDFQYPYVDYNMAFGGGIEFDQTGPVSKTGFKINYAYQINELGMNDGRFSIGISGSGNQYRFDPNGESARDSDDPILGTGNETKFFPNVGVGIFYLSSLDKYRDNTVFYLGVSAQQAYEIDVFTQRLNQQRFRHIYADLGAKIYSDKSFIEPYVSATYSNPDMINALFGINYEMEELFWAGLGYVTSGDFTLQAGYILKEVGGYDTRLKLGVLGSVPASDRISTFGPSAEFFLRYEFDQQ